MRTNLLLLGLADGAALASDMGNGHPVTGHGRANIMSALDFEGNGQWFRQINLIWLPRLSDSGFCGLLRHDYRCISCHSAEFLIIRIWVDLPTAA